MQVEPKASQYVKAEVESLEPPKPAPLVLIAGVGLFFVVIIISLLIGETAKYDKSINDWNQSIEKRAKEAEAERMARREQIWERTKEVVRERLKSPGTANFGEQTAASTVLDNKFTGVAHIRGFVDSQNGFGAVVRSYFYYQASRAEGSGTWTFSEHSFKQRE
jgi:hypothetical protein